MIRNEIIESIDAIKYAETDSSNAVMEALIYSYEKQALILEHGEYEDIPKFAIFPNTNDIVQESVDNTKADQPKSIFKKIMELIKSFFRMIKRQIDKFIAQIVAKKRKRSASANAIILSVLENSEYNKPDDIDSWPVPKIRPSMIKNKKPEPDEKQEETVVTEAYKETPITKYKHGPMKVRIPAGKDSVFASSLINVPTGDIVVGFDEKKETVRFRIFGTGKLSSVTVADTFDNDREVENIDAMKKTWFGSPKTSLYFISHTDDFNQLVDLVKLACDIIKKNDDEDVKEFNTKTSKVIKELNKKSSKMDAGDVEISMNELLKFQKLLNNQVYAIDKFTDINSDISKLDKKTVKNMNDLVYSLNRIQFSLNQLTSALDDRNIVNSQFIGCIKSCAMLDIFVKSCIDAGIPPKYIAYNTWLVADECIRGKGDKFKPVWGQTRAVLFPPNDKVVYKVALSGAGIISNEAEERTSRVFVDAGRVDLIAPILRTWRHTSIVAMQRIKSQGKPSYARLVAFSKDINNTVKKYEESSGKKLNVKITDLHKDNVMYDIENGVYRCIDYGITSRAK